MNDEELEQLLREGSAGPGAGVEAAVLGSYDAVYGSRRFWKRPVPMYQAAASLVLVAGLALVLGRMSGPQAPPIRDPALSSPVAEVGWSTAAPDVLSGD
jgi:hypothetical protein